MGHEAPMDERLLAVRRLEDEHDALASSSQTALTDADRDRLLALGADLERAWHSPTPRRQPASGSSAQ